MTYYDALGPEYGYFFYEAEYSFFEKWQAAVASLVAIWPAAGRREVLKLQRIMDADYADAFWRTDTYGLENWAKDHADDLVRDMEAAVQDIAAGDRSECFDVLDGMQDSIAGALEHAENPEY